METVLWRATLFAALMTGACMSQQSRPDPAAVATVRYQVSDIDRSISFYTQVLGFQLENRVGSAFAIVSQGPLRLLLSGPGSSGSRLMPDGRSQQPGGWNRIVIYVNDLGSQIDQLAARQVRFRNQIESGPGGRQIQIEDPDGNPIELHEPPPG